MPNRTSLKTFRISSYLETMLESRPYNRAPGLLIEIVLTDFFDSKDPKVDFLRKKFLSEIRTRKLNRDGKITAERREVSKHAGR